MRVSHLCPPLRPVVSRSRAAAWEVYAQCLVTEAWQLLPRAGTLLLGTGVPCRSLHRQDAPYCNEVV